MKLMNIVILTIPVILALGSILVVGAAEPSPFTVPIAGEKPLYLDPEANLDKRVADLVGRMTLEEKAQALDHNGPTLARFGLRADHWNQCLNGVAAGRPTTMFPTCIAMGATWNPDLVHEIATVLSDEARAIYNAGRGKGGGQGLIFRDPVINISRNPYWGRIHEVFSEDPVLTGRMGVAYVKGLQGDDPHYLKIAATLKHFAVNNTELGRMGLNAVVPERWLRDYWLPHFREAVIEGHAQSVMASYNAINGVHNNVNHWLLTDVLKTEWGHQGFVVSDLGGVKTMVDHAGNNMTNEDAVAQSIMAGCDFSDKEYSTYIPAAVQEGKITMARLDDAVTRVLRVRFRLGEFDSQERQPWHNLSAAILDGPANHAVALKAAQQSMVLLQNSGGFLPLDGNTIKRVAVIGPSADVVTTNNYYFKQVASVTPLQGLKNRFPGIEFTHVIGAEISEKPYPWVKEKTPPAKLDLPAEIAKAVEAAKAAEVVLLFLGTNPSIEMEGVDRKTLGLPGNQEELLEAVVAANPRTVLMQMSAGPLSVPWAKEHVPAIVQAWWPGCEGGNAIADVLFGIVNPAGRLPYTIYASDAQVPPQNEYDISKGFTYMFVKGEPLFPFGHGLSYTTFTYADLQVSPKQVPVGSTVSVSVDVTNSGARAGDEVVQLYMHAVGSPVVRAQKELCAFRRISLKAGEKTRVTLEIPARKLATWDVKAHAFLVEAGKVDLMVGASSSDIRLHDQIDVMGGGSFPP